MKKLLSLAAVTCLSITLLAQKVDYKKNVINVNGKDIAKVDVQKENLGLTKNFNLYSMKGEKLVIAVLSTEFQNDKNDNMSMFYRFTFVPTNQVGIFKLPSLSMEKGFANIIGKAGIIEGNTLNAEKVSDFIATRGVSPRTAVNYTLVQRNKFGPVELKEDKTIHQGGEEIGFFNPTFSGQEMSSYEFFIPGGILVAKVSFSGGNNAQNFELFTASDNVRKIVPIPQKEQVNYHQSVIDPNALTLKRITAWLVEHKYL